jgi:sugar lactone lactonase YvrE
MSPNQRAYVVLIAMALGLMTVSCSSSRATLDMTFNRGITWPGEPEKPRIQYLWSLKQVAGVSGKGAAAYIAGAEDISVTGPRYSDFLRNPQGVYLDDNNSLYITDTGAGRVSIVNLDTLKSFNVLGDRGFMLISPIGVVADGKGNIYVSDSELRRVIVFNSRGEFIRFFEGELERPTGLAMDKVNDIVYVADTWTHMIHAYSLEGKRLSSIGSEGSGDELLNYPTFITVDGEGNLYVADTLNFKVKKFSPSGELMASFGIVGDSMDTFDKIKGIAVDSEGHIYVTDSRQDMVKIFDQKGRLLLSFGEKGWFYGDFAHPSGIFIDKSNRIFVSDMLNRRVQVFQFLGGG